MSVSITGTPAFYTPAYNEQVVVASSTQTAQTNFRYRCEIVDNTLTNVLATVDVFPDANNLCVFDAKRVVESYVTSNPTTTSMTELSKCAESFKQYYVKVWERYGTTLTNHSSGITSAVYAFNAAQRWEDFTSWNDDTYFIKSGNVANFLTNAPDSQNIYSNEKAFLHFGVRTSGIARKARIKTYDSSGSLIQTVLIKNNYNNINVNDGGRIMRMPSGWNLNDLSSGEITSGSLPIITASVASWVIDIYDDSGLAQLTNTRTYVAAIECTPHTSYRVHFLNALGGFDSFTFNRKHEIKDTITKQSFEPVYGSVSGGTWSYAKTDQRKKDFYIETNQTYKLNSDWISEAQSTWLYELITSPEVYIEIGGSLRSCYVKAAEYVEKIQVSDKIFNLELEIELGKSVRQRW